MPASNFLADLWNATKLSSMYFSHVFYGVVGPPKNLRSIKLQSDQ